MPKTQPFALLFFCVRAAMLPLRLYPQRAAADPHGL
jgi:hypothetical protein